LIIDNSNATSTIIFNNLNSLSKKILHWCTLPSASELHPKLHRKGATFIARGRGRTCDQTIASPMPWPLGHDITHTHSLYSIACQQGGPGEQQRYCSPPTCWKGRRADGRVRVDALSPVLYQPERLRLSHGAPATGSRIWNPDHLACKSMYRYIPVYTGIYRYILCYLTKISVLVWKSIYHFIPGMKIS
jgi:hypothetical protein